MDTFKSVHLRALCHTYLDDFGRPKLIPVPRLLKMLCYGLGLAPSPGLVWTFLSTPLPLVVALALRRARPALRPALPLGVSP